MRARELPVNHLASRGAAAARQRADAVVPGRHGRADRHERARLGALPAPGSGGLGHGARLPAVRGRQHLPDGRSGLGGDGNHRDVHARQLGAPAREHALPLDLRQQRRGRARPGPLSPLLHRRRARGDRGARRSSPSPSRAKPTRRSRTWARAARSRRARRLSLLLPRAKVLTLIIFVLREVPGALSSESGSASSCSTAAPRSRTPKRAAASRSSRTSAASSSASSPLGSSNSGSRSRPSRH